jgi:uncharacterized membrane protein (UPF0127 family)
MNKQITTKEFGHIKVGNKHYLVEVASDDDTRHKGLSRRTSLNEGFGMLFDMPKEDFHAFQMKETFVPLDMVFISRFGQIVDYIPNVQPLTDGPYKPKDKCKFVLEVRGNDLKNEMLENAIAKMNFYDTMERAMAHKEKQQLEEQLIKYLNEAVNGEKVRRKQTSTRKNSIGSRKVK